MNLTRSFFAWRGTRHARWRERCHQQPGGYWSASRASRTRREFLAPDYVRLDRYVESAQGIGPAADRSRTFSRAETRREFVSGPTFRGWLRVPGFSQVDKTLIKLRAFFDAKLPR